MDSLKEETQRLIDEYLTLTDSKENQRRLACLEPEICADDIA